MDTMNLLLTLEEQYRRKVESLRVSTGTTPQSYDETVDRYVGIVRALTDVATLGEGNLPQLARKQEAPAAEEAPAETPTEETPQE